MTTTETKRVWGNYVLQQRMTTGTAARRNRGSYSGVKVHRVIIEEVVGVVDEAAEAALNHDTFGKRFLKTRKPVIFSASPACGCTSGQHAAQERAGLTVTCTKCGITE